MSVPHKPHSITITPQAVSKDANHVLTGYSSGTPITVRGCATQLTPGQSYDVFGEIVDDAWAFYIDPGNEASCAVGGEVTYNGKTYAIEKVQINNQSLPTDHTVLYATRYKRES